MHDMAFGKDGRAKRAQTLRQHIGARITAKTAWGKMVAGTLTGVTGEAAFIDGVSYSLLHLVSARAHVGGDWSSASGHHGAIRDAKLFVRLHSTEKEFLARAAHARSKTVTDIVREGALAYASKVLNAKPPAP